MWDPGWGRIFTTGLAIMGLHFYRSYENGVTHFQDLGGGGRWSENLGM